MKTRADIQSLSGYRIHLNFLPVIGELPAFRISRQLRDNPAAPRPGVEIHGYSLPHELGTPEQRDDYWVSLQPVSGFTEATIAASANHALTRLAVFDALKRAAEKHVSSRFPVEAARSLVSALRLSMRHHAEGVEELVLEPYFLKVAQRFGIIADFHFRLNDGVPFSRRIQQLSLSLDDNYRRNLNYYVDRSSKIALFLADVEGVLRDVRLPGATSPLVIDSQFLPVAADRLRGRVYVFGSEKESRSQFNGLRDFGPLKPVETPPQLMFVFREKHRQAARTLAIALKGGQQQRERYGFPGFEKLFRTSVKISSEPFVLDDFSENSMRAALETVRSRGGKVIPVLVIPDDEETGYLNHKATFAHAGIATQACTVGVIQDDRMLKWAASNIALQIFCKAGGLPWKVRPTADRSLIIGISQSHKLRVESERTSIEKYFAFSVLTDSSGLFQKIQVLGEAPDEADYLTQLRRNVRDMLMSNAQQFARVVIHTSFKLKQREIEAIYSVARDAAVDAGSGHTRFAVVKVNQKTRFFGVNRGVNSLVPYEATRVRLGPREYLVWFEGIFPDKLTVTKAFAGPTHLQFLRIREDKDISEEILLQELVDLSGANWRGFNAKSAPISTFYCHLIADLVHDFHERNLPLPTGEAFYPWFL